MLCLPDPDQVLFAADMHLDDRHPVLVGRFLDELAARLQGSSAAGSTLFLLGDLFEYWIGDDAPGQAAWRLATLLRDFAARGGQSFLMHGNRDFLMDAPIPGQPELRRYSQHCRATLLPDPTLVEIQGERILLSHGDLLCTDDHPYQRWRAQCRQPAWQQALLARSVPERIALAQSLRQQSHAEQQGAVMLADVNQAAVDALMDAHHCRILVHGHTHRPALHQWSHPGGQRRRWVLSDWTETAVSGENGTPGEQGGQPKGHILSFRQGMAMPPV
ncbi:MAG: UDP-2,3-diacylglucosamine diphosphatase [Lautropia sp.]|nr:UDP-2,3-diacylglucosamine diphosphatase [Lautropia sp.]